MTRPDLDTQACVNPECQHFRRPGATNLTVCKVYGHDRIRLLRCRTCGEERSERRGSALFNTKLPDTTAEDIINHLGEGCSVRATARLVKVAKEAVARLLRVTGRHAPRFHDQHVHGLTPRALEFDEQWRKTMSILVGEASLASHALCPLRRGEASSLRMRVHREVCAKMRGAREGGLTPTKSGLPIFQPFPTFL
jgi:transposase-like protein